MESEDPQEEPTEERVVSDSELQRLRDLLKQRDDEISVLLKMLKQEKRRAADAEASLQRSGGQPIKPSSPILGRTSPLQLEARAPPPRGTSPTHTDGRGDREERGVVDSRQSQDSTEWRAAVKAGIVA